MILIEFKDKDLAMLRAALACAAADTDPRGYLQGIHITDQFVSATNGHRYARFSTPGDHEPFDTIIPKCHLAKAVIHLVLMVNGDTVTFHQTTAKGSCDPIELPLLDGKFPDMSRVIPADDDTGTTDMLKFNPMYLCDVARALDLSDFPVVKMHVTGDSPNSVYRVEFVDYPALTFGIMPIRL